MMEEQAPPVPPEEVGSGAERGSVVDVTLKRKTVHTNVTVVESATRFWLSAQVMIACIMLGLLALSIHSSRGSISYFPETFNTSCINATYEVKNSIEEALIVMLDEAVNITNEEYQNSVNLTRLIVSKSMNMSIELFIVVLKNVDPLLYCTMDSGLAMMQNTRSTLRNINNSIPTISCPISGTGIDICKDATNALQDVAGKLGGVLGSWPDLPPSMADVLNKALDQFQVNKYVNDLANFPAPDFVLTVNSTDVVQKAMANASSFRDIALTCTSVSVKFDSATQHTAKVMYYIEIAIWAAIAALLIGIFIVAIVRQFPTVFVEWVTSKINHYTDKWNDKMDDLEKNTVRTWKLYMIWTLKYINFKKAILTTAYGIAGIILVYNLTRITNEASKPIEIWVNTSLGPGISEIQAKLQDGINEVIAIVEDEMNFIIQEEILNALVPANGTLSDILKEKNHIIDVFNNVTNTVADVPVIGPAIANGMSCMLPFGALNLVNTAIDLMVSFMQELLGAKLTFPKFSFPDISNIAVTATHIFITRTVSIMQAELLEFQVIFIILSAAFGILVLQGLLFVALRRIAVRIKKQRRLSRMNRHSGM